MSEDPSISSTTEPANEGSSVVSVAPKEVEAELQAVLLSAEFRGSKRCQDFLRFVVEETLKGVPHGLKERTIGIGVFGREVAYDTNEDGTVRIKASEVRKRLSLYYAGTGKDSEIRITLPIGTYVPIFSKVRGPLPQKSYAVLTEPQAQKSTGGTSHSWRTIIVSAAVIVAVMSAVVWPWIHHSASMLDQFWAPVLQNSAPVLVAAAYAPVYEPRQPNGDSTQPLSSGDFIVLNDQYVGGGDLIAAARVTGMLGRMGRAYNVRIENSFQDLSDGPSIMIGYSSTQWAPVTKDFRFFIDDNDRGMIRDFGKPTDWYPKLTFDRHTDEDYAIISRAQNSQTHSILVLVTGCTQYGTEAAANVITSPDLLAEALQGAPKDWQRKNLQLVLKIKVIANSPASPKVIASYYW
jgi:hypothetical protein